MLTALAVEAFALPTQERDRSECGVLEKPDPSFPASLGDTRGTPNILFRLNNSLKQSCTNAVRNDAWTSRECAEYPYLAVAIFAKWIIRLK